MISKIDTNPRRETFRKRQARRTIQSDRETCSRRPLAQSPFVREYFKLVDASGLSDEAFAEVAERQAA